LLAVVGANGIIIGLLRPKQTKIPALHSPVDSGPEVIGEPTPMEQFS